MCIQTKSHPHGERLTVEELLDIMIKLNTSISIFLDCCYSGNSVYRAFKYLKYHNRDNGWFVKSSCLENCVSYDTKYGGLLIAD